MTKVRRPFGMRWFGIYAVMLIVATIAAVVSDNVVHVGLFVFISQLLFALSIPLFEVSKPIKRWMLEDWIK